MKYALPLALLLLLPFSAHADGPAELIARMTDPKASFNERCVAEDELAKLGPEVVLPKLLPLLAKGMPEGGIWNGTGDRVQDSKGPVAWQIWYAVHRVWGNQLQALTPKEKGKMLVALLKDAANAKEKLQVVDNLANFWDPSAEPDLAKLLRDPGVGSRLRQAAAFALTLHGKEDYRDVMLQWAGKAEHADKVRWFEMLADPRYKARMGTDARVTQLGFHLILAEKAMSPNYIHGAYFLALKAGSYVGEEFAPSTKDPRYSTKKGGLREQYFVDTVSNALRWWEKNGPK